MLFLQEWFTTSVSVQNTLFKNTAQKMEFSIKDFLSKCDQIYKNLLTWSHLLKKSLMEDFNVCAVKGKNILSGTLW